MRNYQTVVLALVFIAASSVVLAQNSYVRKHLEPDFFMPEEVKSKPEKLPPLTRAKNRTVKENSLTETDVDIVPDYKNKYDQYLSDLEELKKNGTLPENQQLNEDLQQMNSSERFLLNSH